MPTIEKRGSGYRITVSAGYDMQGKQIKKRMTWKPLPGMTEKQIQKELERQKVLFEQRVQSGQILDGSTRFSDFADYWLKVYAEKQLRPSTVAGYKAMLVRINAAIGNIRLDRLQPTHLIQFYNSLAENGARNDVLYQANEGLAEILKSRSITRQSLSEQSGLAVRTVSLAVRGERISRKTAERLSAALGKSFNMLFNAVEQTEKLSGTTALHYHRLISSILEKAVKWQVIYANPCARVEPPKAEHREAEYLDETQSQQLLDCLQAEPLPYRAMITVLLYTGMRRGELCGLEWSDIDFDNRLIDISKTSLYLSGKGIFNDDTKTEASKRVIKIPNAAIEVLKEHRKEQLTAKFKLGDKWIESGKVFTQWNGKPIYPGTITKWFSAFIKKNNLPPIHLHSLRHTNATLLIASGADLRTVSKRLGHSNMTTTSNIYTHAIKSADEKAAELLGDILHPIKSRA